MLTALAATNDRNFDHATKTSVLALITINPGLTLLPLLALLPATRESLLICFLKVASSW